MDGAIRQVCSLLSAGLPVVRAAAAEIDTSYDSNLHACTKTLKVGPARDAG
jgi:hypothetical protein